MFQREYVSILILIFTEPAPPWLSKKRRSKKKSGLDQRNGPAGLRLAGRAAAARAPPGGRLSRG